MKRIHVMVNDEARAVIDQFQTEQKISSLDEAVERYILQNKNKKVIK